jgi:predicted DNA-binding transcriptional regulator AlpA
MSNHETLLSARQTAQCLGVTVAHLQRLRSEGGGPLFVKVGKRRVGYRAVDLARWIEARVVANTAEARQRGVA